MSENRCWRMEEVEMEVDVEVGEGIRERKTCKMEGRGHGGEEEEAFRCHDDKGR